MFIDFFDASGAIAFADEFALKTIRALGKRNLVKKQKGEAIAKNLLTDIEQFKASYKLNFYKKAKLGARYREVLMNNQVAPEYAKELTYNLLTLL